MKEHKSKACVCQVVFDALASVIVSALYQFLHLKVILLSYHIALIEFVETVKILKITFSTKHKHGWSLESWGNYSIKS